MDFAILTSVHTHYVAQLLQARFQYHGASSKIFFSYSPDLDADFFIVLSPQIFPDLPPPRKRIIFQMEQSTSTRWFTKKYLEDMEISVGILDYSLENIKRIRGLGIQNTSTYYLPIGANTKFGFQAAPAKDYDFVFYGDYYSSERRQKLIQALQTCYRVLILQDIFESELYEAIARAKAVINLHYYEDPLLETTRLCECLSLGMPVLSEATMDNDAYPEFSPAVRYFEEGSVDDLMVKAQWFLDNLPSAQLIHSAALASEEKFNAHFDRAFIALKLLPINQARKTIAKYFKMLRR